MEYKKFSSQDKKQYYLELGRVFDEYNNNGKKTVVIVSDNYYPIVDGVLAVIENYAKNLKDRLNIVICVPTHRWKVPIQSDYTVLFCDSLYFHPLRYDYSQAKSDRKFKKMLDKLRIDLMHIHSPYFTGRFMVDYANKNHIPVISTFHTQYHQDLKRVFKLQSLSDAVLDVLMKVFYQSDLVLTMSTATRSTLQSYGFRGEIRLLQNGTDMYYDGDEQELIDLCQNTFGVGKDEVMLLFVGRLIKPKNIYLILDAIKHLAKKETNFKMFYVGDGDERTKLKDKVKEYGLQDKVVLTGKILDKTLLKSLYCRADLFVFPSVYDSDSIVKYEAAAFATPSLLLAGSNDACSVVDGQNAFLSDGDPKNMADMISQLINDPARLQAVGANAKQTLYKRWGEIADMAYDIYMEVINSNSQMPMYKGKKNMQLALKQNLKNVKKARKNVKFVKSARKKIAQKQIKQANKLAKKDK